MTGLFPRRLPLAASLSLHIVSGSEASEHAGIRGEMGPNQSRGQGYAGPVGRARVKV